VFRLDPVAAEISFGDYDPVLRPDGHGSIPAAGDAVTAASYRYVAGGASGNVGAGTVVVMTTQVAGIVGVTNLGVGEGGADEETIEDAKRRAPEALRNRYRAVTLEDYAYLAREASTDVAIARALGPRVHQDTSTTYIEGDPWTYGLIDRGAGNVTVVVVPHTGVVAQRPEPTKDLLREVQRYLDRRREATARLRVTGPRYLPVKVTVDAWLWQRALDLGLVASAAAFYTDIENRLKAFLHPVTGGPEGKGWAVGQNVFVKDAYAAAMPDEELGYISSLIVAPETPAYTPVDRPFPATLTSPGAWVAVADYELVCGGQIVKVQHTPVAEI
jgi:predicted phage baseplate assembly protein